MKIYMDRNDDGSVMVHECETLNEAMEWLETETKGMMKVDSEHFCSSDVFSTSHVCCYEVYEDEPLTITVDEDGEETETWNDPLYESDYYYTEW